MIDNLLKTNYKRLFLILFLITSAVASEGNTPATKGESGNGSKGLLIQEMDKIAKELDSTLKTGSVGLDGDKVRVVICSDKLFNSNHIDLSSKEALSSVAEIIKDHELTNVQIDGHTDSMGAGTYNQKLSEGRAASVLSYFTSLGIDEDRMEAKGYGETSPITDNLTEEHRSKNRRIEITIYPSKKMLKLAEKGKLGK